MKDLTNDIIVHKNINGTEFIQFRRLLEFPNLKHCYTLRKNGINVQVKDGDKTELLESYRKVVDSLNKDENFIKNLIKIQEKMDCVDLNIGPARGKLDKIFEWLVPLTNGKNISFDSTNAEAIVQGLKLVQNSKNCFINSTSNDLERLEILTDCALSSKCNLIALTMSNQTGIPKTADERLEIVFEIYESGDVRFYCR